MASFSHERVGGPQGYRWTYKANGAIPMGTLVATNTTALEVTLTGSGAQAIGVALFNEMVAKENAAETYLTTKPLEVEHLVTGQVWNLLAYATVAVGDLCTVSATGRVLKTTATGDFVNFRALEVVAAGSRGRFAVINGRFTTTLAGE